MCASQTLTGLCLLLSASAVLLAQPVPPVPFPSENPFTEEKRLLGKVLFWDEQLSSDRTVACGTCHVNGSGGTDPRVGVHPGPDGDFGTPDDVLGSPGVKRTDAIGTEIEDPLFGKEIQVTSRAANSTIGAAYAPEMFWDGRAASTFIDPETGAQSIAVGGALESQAVVPVVNDVEMAHVNRSWDEVRRQLQRSLPLRDASDLPPDLAAIVDAGESYASLFQAAFGDTEINAERIAFAIATYERTLIADQTPWDAFVAGDAQALTPPQVRGWNDFRNLQCIACHAPPLFTNHSFRNIGIRPPQEDPGREGVTGVPQDRGRFKVPTLRNVGLKASFMHNGRLSELSDAVAWYRPNNPLRFNDNLDPLLPLPIGPPQVDNITALLSTGLTDPRVANEEFPFDRPTLHAGAMQSLRFTADRSATWDALEGAQFYNVYRGTLSSLSAGPDYGDCVNDLDLDPADTGFADGEQPESGEGLFYLLTLIDPQGAERGLGATSEGSRRQVLLPCAGD